MFGADTGPIDKAMRGMKANMASFAEGIGGHLAAAFSIGGAIALLEKATTKVQSIKRMAESLGTSTGFAQDITNVGLAAGLSGESIEKMMDKFIKGLKPGQDVEQELFKLADKLADIPDPAERAQAAIEAFGKSGVKMVAVLGQGSAAVKALADTFSKFSADDIRALEEAKLAHERFGNFLVVWSGRVLIGLRFLGENIRGALTGDFSGVLKMLPKGSEAGDEEARKVAQAAAAKAASDIESLDAIKKYKNHLDEIALKSQSVSHDEKLAILERQKVVMEHEVQTVTSEKDRYHALEVVKDIEEKITEEKRKQTREVEKYGQKIQDAVAKQEGAAFNLNREKSDFTKLSLDDLASNKYDKTVTTWGVGGGQSWTISSPLQQMARQARNEFDLANAAEAWGDTQGAAEHKQNYENLVKNNPALKSMVRLPFEKLEDALNKQTDTLERLLDEDGIVVREFDPVDE